MRVNQDVTRAMEKAYLGCRNSPDFEVVRTHENLIEPLANVANIPLVKIGGLIRW